MTSVASQPHVTKASSTNQVRTVLLTAVAYFMVTLDALVVVTALPSIHREFRRRHRDTSMDGERVHDRVRRRHPDRVCAR